MTGAPKKTGPTFHNMAQGSDEWYAARCGMLTASEMKLIVTPTLKAASNDKERAHLYELLAQRITKYVEPSYQSSDMLKGYEGEIIARQLYAEQRAPVQEVGFVTNDKWGFTLGYSPDGLVGADGQIEIKTRRQKFQVQTVIEDVANGTMAAEFLVQVQTGLLVTERAWCDFLSYSPGLPMIPIRVFPDAEVHAAILDAAKAFEARIAERAAQYHAALGKAFSIPTERVDLGEIAA